MGDTQPGLVGGKLHALDELPPGPRIVRDEDVAVEVDVVEETRDRGARRDAETRLDHAAEHAAETERARSMHHAHRLADPAGFRKLHVDAVRALGRRRDVLERVAVLVDVDPDRRALLQLGPARVSGGKRLLAVLDPERSE